MYSEVLNLSFEERVELYMSLEKEELAKMLAVRDCIEAQEDKIKSRDYKSRDK